MTAKIITISQQKGGAGKSTIAVHLAVALLLQNKKVALIDIDAQSSSSMWIQERRKNEIKANSDISFSSCSGMRLSSEINRLRLLHDYIIVDCPPHTETEAKSAIRSADLVLIPMQPSPTDLWATYKTLEYAVSENKNTKIVLNRFTPGSKISKTLEMPEEYILRSTIGNRVGFALSMNTGLTILETDPNSAGAKEIRGLASELLSSLESQLAA
ncbi:MAG: ParA family partition ATPase [Rickettsiaceae bacterium]|nr:ParA family partition ATPase [Rickettsiaceae bacterium]